MVPLLLSIGDFIGESEGRACRVVSRVKKKYSGGERASVAGVLRIIDGCGG
jgi:hypothetical protein